MGKHQEGSGQRVPQCQGSEQRAEHGFPTSPGREVHYSASERKLWEQGSSLAWVEDRDEALLGKDGRHSGSVTRVGLACVGHWVGLGRGGGISGLGPRWWARGEVCRLLVRTA